MTLPTIAVTMGDPAGIGPEIVVRALAQPEVRACCRPVVIGDPSVMARALELVKSPLAITPASLIGRASSDPNVLEVVRAGELSPEGVRPGLLDRRYGASAAACCLRAVQAAQAGEVGAIVSTPFNKEAFHMAGFTAMDDLVYFQECFGVRDAYMVGEVAGLWVTTVTFHVPFRSIADLITVEAILEKIRGLADVMRVATVSPLRIGVAGLNVHSGEGGLFGREEIEVIRPAVEKARVAGHDVVGPVPPDSLFPNALRGDYRGLVCMYHDQANIGRKILGRTEPGVTLYLGMAIPVVTVPHGTAYDIAWQGVASHAMLVRAITTAAALARKNS